MLKPILQFLPFGFWALFELTARKLSLRQTNRKLRGQKVSLIMGNDKSGPAQMYDSIKCPNLVQSGIFLSASGGV